MRARKFLLLGFVAAASLWASPPPPTSPDPLAAEIDRWTEFLRTHTAEDPISKDVEASSEPVLARAREALAEGKRLLALHRLAAARANLASLAYARGRPDAARKDAAGFDAEWARMGAVLKADLGRPRPDRLAGVTPAAVRALGEAALPQVRIFYDASREYGRATMAENGLFYLGNAQAQSELVRLVPKLSYAAPRRSAPKLRSIAPELDALEARILAAYRPPASIEKHPEFIAASGFLKEARELDSFGLRYGALYKYLQAALRAGLAASSGTNVDAEAVRARLRALDRRLLEGNSDDSLARLYVETAEADLASPLAGKTPATAAVIASDVLPLYLAVLEPPRPRAGAPTKAARPVTVTLVRWPYT